ncbi:retrotransposon protein, putative, ty1-copia subclass [Tanacetum coccineum]
MLFTMRETYVDRNPKSHNVLGIAAVAIIDCQLPFEYTITSRSTDVVVPLPVAPAANSEAQVLLEWNTVYDAYNEVACIILGSMTVEIHRQFENSSPYDMIKELKAMFEKQARVDRNYNMHNMGKTVGKLHAMLIEYEKGLPKMAETPQVMMIKGGKIQKANKKLLKVKGKGKANGKGKDKQVYIPKPKNPKPSAKEHPTKDDDYHHYKEGFREAKKLKQGALYLYVGNGICAQVEAIGSFDLVLPNGLVICLVSCHYAPSITRGVVLVHRLVENRFVQCFTNFGILVSQNNVLYFNVIPSNSIYEIDMHDLVPNVNSIYNLQQEGLLKSTDDESFDQCVSCLSVKMTRKSFPRRPERVTDLLGIIHTDVCGPLRPVSRQGACYFITFTDDYSRYGYVYLLKHKHELTPSYTPQHNGVYERRNRTLLDMVRSMMNLTTLSLSFWDYALESATRILNMVSTKKVDKTPYELWYGKVLNLSYLKVWGCEALVNWDMPEKL